MTAPFAKVTACGLIFDDGPPVAFEDWRAFLLGLCRAEKCIGLALGDCLNYGGVHYGGKYDEAMRLTGLDYQTLTNYAYVARSVPISLRKENLTFEHHARVAALKPDDQEHWLKVCEKAIAKGDYVGTRRLARSIECGKLVSVDKIARMNPDKGFQSHILQITRLVAWHRDWKEGGRFDALSEAAKQALKEDFSRLAVVLADLQEMGCYEPATSLSTC